VSLSALLFFFGFMACVVMAFKKHPVYGLMAYVAVFYMNPLETWWGRQLPDLRWSLFSAFITLIAIMVRSRRKNAPPSVPLSSGGIFYGIFFFFIWLIVQSAWAVAPDLQRDLVSMYFKFTLLVVLFYKCVDSEENLRKLMWAHVVGCAYLGWVAYSEYQGGRFEGFGGGGIGEANAGALQVDTGLLIASAMFLSGKLKDRLILLVLIPFMANALITTISRSGFLALAAGGIVFNLFTPPKFRLRVRVLTILAGALFLMVANPTYWMRIASIGYVGEEVQGTDTGSGRIEILKAQVRMFFDHPLGCGHRCTAVLSPNYLEAKYLTSSDPNGPKGRASHNTVATLTVEQGVPGAIFYALYLMAVFRGVLLLARRFKKQESGLAAFFPALAAIMAAITVGDMFVDHLKGEVRIWFLSILGAMLYLSSPQRMALDAKAAAETPPGPRGRQLPAPGTAVTRSQSRT